MIMSQFRPPLILTILISNVGLNVVYCLSEWPVSPSKFCNHVFLPSHLSSWSCWSEGREIKPNILNVILASFVVLIGLNRAFRFQTLQFIFTPQRSWTRFHMQKNWLIYWFPTPRFSVKYYPLKFFFMYRNWLRFVSFSCFRWKRVNLYYSLNRLAHKEILKTVVFLLKLELEMLHHSFL